MKRVIAIIGPTASGKSDLAVYLAKKLNGEVVSADSRQVYKSLDIGSAKITKEEMEGVTHHMLDVVAPSVLYNVEQYQKDAKKVVEDILSKNRLPVICGGTGFYVKALIDNISFPNVSPDKKLRQYLDKKTTEELVGILKEKDGERFEEIDKKNRPRLIRAIEIANSLGKVPKIESNPLWKTLQIGLEIPLSKLKERINKRILDRLEKGMIEEVEGLRRKGLSDKRLESFGLEYRYISQYLQNKISFEEMVQVLSKESFSFAKRQMTWFRKDKRIKWFSPDQKEEILEKVKIFLT